MATFIDDIRLKFRQGDLLIKLIYINILVFIILNVLTILFKLGNIGNFDLESYIALPSSPADLLTKPWTLITYMFSHREIWHILFNMLVLYWFARMFLSYFNERQLVGLYLIGGLAGALIYILAFNLIPYYANMNGSLLLGASAAVMAIVFGISFYQKDLSMNLIFIGPVKIYLIAVIMFAIDFISLDDMSNPGGHIAHIGGAIAGYIFAQSMRKGNDITSWINRIVDLFVNLFTASSKNRATKMKVKFSKREEDYEYNNRKHDQEANVDSILDKIKQSGYDSLSKEEKKKLFDASKK